TRSTRDWSSDVCSSDLPQASSLSVGVGEVNAGPSVDTFNPPNPNRALDAFLVTNPFTGAPVFDAASWAAKAAADASWADASWARSEERRVGKQSMCREC